MIGFIIALGIGIILGIITVFNSTIALYEVGILILSLCAAFIMASLFNLNSMYILKLSAFEGIGYLTGFILFAIVGGITGYLDI